MLPEASAMVVTPLFRAAKPVVLILTAFTFTMCFPVNSIFAAIASHGPLLFFCRARVSALRTFSPGGGGLRKAPRDRAPVIRTSGRQPNSARHCCENAVMPSQTVFFVGHETFAHGAV